MYLEEVRDEQSERNDTFSTQEALYARARLSEREHKAQEGPDEDCPF